MKRKKSPWHRRIPWPVVVLLAAVALLVLCSPGCVPRRVRVGWVTYADHLPPAPLVEVTPVSPMSGAVWVNGYWWWNGARFVWIRGHWATPPSGTYVWLPSGWTRVGSRYRFVPGRWVPRGHRPRVGYVRPVPPARVRRVPRYRTIRPRGQAPRARPGVRRRR